MLVQYTTYNSLSSQQHTELVATRLTTIGGGGGGMAVPTVEAPSFVVTGGGGGGFDISSSK